MKPIVPAEISALLDGELPPDRAEEVRLAIDQDASLLRVYQELTTMDADLKASAACAMFQPQVIMPAAEDGYGLRILFATIILVILRLAMKLSPPQLATMLSIALLAVVVGWLLRRLVQISEEECLLLAADGSVLPPN